MSEINDSTSQNFKPVILVTGCGSGIGLATAILLNKRNDYRVVVTARKTSIDILRDQVTENEFFWVRELDVTIASDREGIVSEIEAKWGQVNVLVNNAGISFRAVVEHMTNEDEQRQMATNYFGPMALTRRVLPKMRLKGRGKIINVSSVSGMLAMPTMASYSASKAALDGATEALWYETKPLGISVCLIQPGFIRSNSFEKVYFTAKSSPDSVEEGEYKDYYANMAPFISRLMGLSRKTPEDIGELIVRTIKRHNSPLWIPATLDAVFFYYVRRIIPRRLLLPLLYWLLPNSKNWAKNYTHKRGS